MGNKSLRKIGITRAGTFEQRTERFSVRFTPSETKLLGLKNKTEGEPGTAAVIRVGALLYASDQISTTDADGVIWTGQDNDGAKERAHQLRRIGGNVNQVSTALNSISLLLRALEERGEITSSAIHDMAARLPDAGTIQSMLDDLEKVLREEQEWINELTGRRKKVVQGGAT